MQQLLQQNRSHSSIHSQENVSPREILETQQHEVCGDSGCPSSCSHVTHAEDDRMTLAIPDNTAYMNIQSQHDYSGSRAPLSSPHEASSHSQYEVPINGISSLKRKRSCFEISEDSVADFIDKGLISPECAVSYFNTCVSPFLTPSKERELISFIAFSRAV